MSWSDPIADMLTRIRNAQKAALPQVEVPASRVKSEIARVLKAEGFLADFACDGDGAARRVLRLSLKYGPGEEPAIRGLRRESKPGLRRFCGRRDIPRVLGGMGVCVLSTPGGIMSGTEARKRNLGGELICTVW
jgi:small subunit ribosomal protein S8